MNHHQLEGVKDHTLTGEDVKSRLFVIRGVSIGGVADNHTSLPNRAIPNHHTADRRFQRVVLLQAHRRNS